MKNKKYLLLIFIMNMFFTIINSVLAASTDSQYYANNDSGKYKVLKIKSVKSIYVIYAVKNDSIYKIVSRKVNVNCSDSKKIHRKGIYKFSLETLFPRTLMGIEFPPPGSTGRMGKYYYGTTVSIEPENDIWDLFEATNLKGLYIEKEDIVSD